MSIQILRYAIQPISPAYRGGMDSKLFSGFLSYEGQVLWMRGGAGRRRPADPVRDQELATGHDCDVSRHSPAKLSTGRLLPVNNTDGGMRYASPADEKREVEVEPGGNDLGKKQLAPGGKHGSVQRPVSFEDNHMIVGGARHRSDNSAPAFFAFPTPYNPPGEIPGDHLGFRIDIWL